MSIVCSTFTLLHRYKAVHILKNHIYEKVNSTTRNNIQSR
jgi:hypothetical protein